MSPINWLAPGLLPHLRAMRADTESLIEAIERVQRQPEDMEIRAHAMAALNQLLESRHHAHALLEPIDLSGRN